MCRGCSSFLLVMWLSSAILCWEVAANDGPVSSVRGVSFAYREAVGLGWTEGVVRRDPSDVIRVGEMYYVYYSKVDQKELPANKRHLRNSGYAATVWCATSSDGVHWRERKEVLGLGQTGTWDSFGVFTPNILKYDGAYWLYYTGVQPTPGRRDGTFENNSENDVTAIGVARGDTPLGPFCRVSGHPVLTTSPQPADFDSYRVDDACLLVREGKIWLYYKGRCRLHGRTGPSTTKMGVAVSDAPTGPFTKLNGGRPVQDSGHEVQIWPFGPGVMSLVSPTGPNGRTLQYAPDGLHFRIVLSRLQAQPRAPGMYRPELTNPDIEPGLPTWGIDMGLGKSPFLRRFECRWKRAD